MAAARHRLGLCSPFSTNSASCFSTSWNQLCWCFHPKPSSAIHVQMVESDRWTPWRSSKALYSLFKVHSSNECPSERGFRRAKLTSAPRTSWPCTDLRPGHGRSSSPARPSSLSRLTYITSTALLLKSALYPASAAVSSGASIIAATICARWTRRIGSFRDVARHLISASSSAVNTHRSPQPNVERIRAHFSLLARRPLSVVSSFWGQHIAYLYVHFFGGRS